MEIKKDRTLIHLFFSSYTIGFVVGGIVFFITETKKDFQFSFTGESFFSLLILLPIIYWVYCYTGTVFNNQSLKIKSLYFALCLLGMFFGIVFFELILS